MWGRVFLNRYRVLRLLGEGGMGRAYLARELEGERLVVIKVLHEQYARAAHYRQSFQREIELLSRFRHPGAVEFYEAAVSDDHGPCLVMEYVHGEALDEMLRRHGRLSPERVGHMLGRLCGVLQAAHAQGIIHRDLKPANIMVVDADTANERLKVLDFGLARLAVASPQGIYIPLEQFTGARANGVVGTPEYMCPEALRGEQVDHRGDLYSVGIVLYELLTGYRPFEGETASDILSAQAHRPPPPFACWQIESNIPAAIEAVVQACLAKDPANRPQSAHDLAERYGAALGQPIWDASDVPQPLLPVPTDFSTPAETADEPNTVVYRLEAWMPEQVAAVKLRGFLDAAGGEVVESLPGLIRVRFWRRLSPTPEVPSPRRWPWSGFQRGTKPVPVFEQYRMDVAMMRPAGDTSSRLLLTVRLRPEEALPLPRVAEWREWCDHLHRDLKAYLLAQK